MSAIPEVRWYKPRSRWAIRVRGRRHYFPAGTTKQQAASLARVLLADAGYPVPGVTVLELATLWADAQAARLSTSAAKANKTFVDAVGRFEQAKLGASAIEPARVRHWLARQGPGRKRGTLNYWLWCLKSSYRWGVERDLVEWKACYRIGMVSNIRRGEAGAESSKRRPPTDEAIRAVRERLAPHHRDLLDLMLLTGARCGELLSLSASDLDTSTDPWVYTPKNHKTAHAGKQRVILLGPDARQIVVRILTGQTILTRHQAFWKAIRVAAAAAGSEAFTPHQLRHKAATDFRARYGIDKARLLLGHSSVAQTDDYTWTAVRELGSLVERSKPPPG